MKRLTMIALAWMASLCTLMAIPADKRAARLQQPDGSYVSISLHGDEYMSFNTTDDGYSVVKNANGFFVYATLDDQGRLTATKQVAHESVLRSAEEVEFLKDMPKMLTPRMSEQASASRSQARAQRAQTLAAQRAAAYDYSKFRGLILLVEYNDCPFRYDDYRELMDEMVNSEDYKGNAITNINLGAGYRTSNWTGQCTGSVRDFYSDCSKGLFIPQFDVVGPIKVDRSQYYVDWKNSAQGGGNNVAQLMVDVLNAADPVVDFKQYDGDNDGVVDLVYLIFSGLGSNISGNDERLIWPHQSDFYNPNSASWYIRKDGKRLGHYACSTELYGTKQWSTLDGIGTITHEFGHVLGLPDFYDTDYEESGGESHHPGEWTVMAGGGYLNYGRTPTVYTLFERYALGWATPQVISAEGDYTLESIDVSHTGYRINSRVNKEFFMLENRQQVKWNQFLPGHGMLVFRVDSTNSVVWNRNELNCNPEHNYFELLRAGGFRSYESASDPFPGSRNVTTLDNSSSPANLLSWSGKATHWGLKNIAENSGVITFTVVDADVLQAITMPESINMDLGTKTRLTVTRDPDYVAYSFTWTSSDESVCTVDDEGVVTAQKAGTAVITVTDSGINKVSAQCIVTVTEWAEMANVAAFKSLEDGANAALVLNNAQVTYVSTDNDIYLRDASGSIVITGSTLTLSQGDVLNGKVLGQYSIKNRIPQLKAIDVLTNAENMSVVTGETVEPKTIHVSQLSENDYAELVVLKSAKLKLVSGVGIYAVSGDNECNIYNSFGLKGISSPKTYNGKRFDVTGIFSTRTVSGQLMDHVALIDLKEVEPVYYNLAYSVGEGGYLLLHGETAQLAGEGQLDIMGDEALELDIVLLEGYEVGRLRVNGIELPEAATTINVPAIVADMTLEVAFNALSGISSPNDGSAADGKVKIYTADGRMVGTALLDGNGLLQTPLSPGLYIIKSGDRVKKILKK